MAQVDFYVVLGIERTATVAEVRRAYKRLARRYHPDINPGDRAAAAFYEVLTRAYETLRDPGRRQAYDSGNETGRKPPAVDTRSATVQFQGFDFSAGGSGARPSATFADLFADMLPGTGRAPDGRPGSAERGGDLFADLVLSFEEAIQGVERRLTVSRLDVCERCGGSGRRRAAEGSCGRCHGRGSQQWRRGHMIFSTACGDCGGTGRLRHQPCSTCDGHGVAPRDEEITVVVPAGVDDGTRLRVGTKGNAGRRGGAPGDLYLAVRVTAHRHFRRAGSDLLIDVPIAIHEAALGARVEVPTLDGSAPLEVPAGTTTGQRFRIRGQGAPSARGAARRGDLLVTVQVVLPEVTDERSRKLLREFGEIHTNDVRHDMFDE